MNLKTSIFSILFLFFLPGFIYAENQTSLSVAYNVGVAPLKFTDDSGKDTGLLFDSWKIISEKINRDIQFVKATNFSESVEQVKTGEVEFHLGLFKTEEREQYLQYTDPILSVDYYIFTNSQLAAVNKLSDLEGIVLGLTEGGYTEEYVKKTIPEQMLRIYPTYKELFDAAVKGEIKAFIAQEFALLYYLNIRQLANVFHYKSEVPLYTQTYYSAISKENPQADELIERINTAISSLTIEERTQSKNKWFKTRITEIPPEFREKLNDAQKKYLSEKGIVTVQNDQDWDPFNFNNNGVPEGVTIDYLRLLGEKSGIDFRFVSGNQWDRALQMVQNGELDLVCNIVKTPSRDRAFSFSSAPYITIKPQIYIKEGAPLVTNIGDLFGKKIAIPRGFIHEGIFAQYSEIEIVEVDNTTDAIFALSRGRADAILEQATVFNHAAKKFNIDNIVHGGNVNLPGLEQVEAYCATAEENAVLTSILDLAREHVEAIEIEQIRRKWQLEEDALIFDQTDEDAEELSWLGLSTMEKEWLQQHQKVKVWGGVGAWPPIYNIKDGKPAGLAIDYATKIFNDLGIDIELISIPWKQGLFKYRDGGNIDVFPAIAYTDERSKDLNFTEPHLSFPFVIFNRKNSSLVSSLVDLHGKTIAVAKGFVATSLLEKEKSNFDLLYVDSPQEALESVSHGKADAYVGNLAAGSYLIDGLGLTNLKVASPTKYESYQLSMGVRKDWPELISIINKYLASMSDEDHATLRQKTFAIRYEHGIDKMYVAKVVLATIFIVSIVVLYVLYWNRKMAAEILQRKRIEAELRKLSEAVEQNPVAVVIFNKMGKIEYVNPVFTEVTGVSEREAEGKDFFFLLAEENRKNLLDHVWQTINDGSVWRGETCSIVKGDRELWGSVSVSPIFDEAHQITHFVSVHEDITERRHMVQELMEAKDAAESATQAKSDFLANMSHEIRTPMNAVMGMTHLALQTELNSKQRNFLTKIDSSAKALLRIINDILDFSKIEAGKLDIEKTEFHLDSVLESLANLLTVDVESKGLELLFHVESDVPMNLIGDPLRLNQILLNLISNSIKFTEDGEIVVTISRLESDSESGLLKFAVTDTGIGITKKQQGKLFQSFSQADTSTTRKFGGTGLGLAICNSLVNLMQGEIGVDSSPGHGSTFWFTARFSLHEKDRSSPKLLAEDFLGMRVLVVDDNKTSRMILTDFLTNMGCDVSSVSSGKQAIVMVNDAIAEDNNFELVLMDWKMPSMNGIETTLELKQIDESSNPPVVIMVTAYGREEIMHQAQSAGVAGFLVKPVNQSVLLNTIMEVFGKTTGTDDSTAVPHGNFTQSGESIPGVKILVVEDNKINQEIVLNLLENLGAVVTIANNGREAIDRISQAEFDLVLMDIQMPEMDGFEATQQIKQMEGVKDIPILAMTAHAMAGDREESLQAGMVDHISKPINPQELFDTIKRWVQPAVTVKNITPALSDTAKSMLSGNQTLDGLNVQDGLHRVNDNVGLYLKLLQIFYDENQDTLERLASGANEENCHLLHTLKSVCGNLGAYEVSKMSGDIEELLRENPSANIHSSLEEFEVSFRSLLASINLLLENKDKVPGKRSSLDESTLQAHFNRMIFLLKDDFAEASDFADELTSALQSDIDETQMAIFLSALEAFDAEKAIDQIKKMATSMNITLNNSDG